MVHETRISHQEKRQRPRFTEIRWPLRNIVAMLFAFAVLEGCDPEGATSPLIGPEDVVLSTNRACGIECVIADDPSVLTNLPYNPDSAFAGTYVGATIVEGMTGGRVLLRLEMEPGLQESLPEDFRVVVSNCLESQACSGSHRRFCLSIALRMVSSFRIQAVAATLKGLPAARRRS